MRREQPIAWVPATERLWLTTWDLCAEAGAADEISGPTTAVHELVYGLVYALDEIVGTVGTMIVGGFQEPAHGAANALLGLLGRPEQAAAVAADPMGLSAATVHEGLRWIPPFNMTEKLTAADVVIRGEDDPCRHRDRDGHRLGEPRRDALRAPRRLRPARDRANNFAFGFGAHFCVGHYVARQVAQITVEELFTRLPGLRLDPDREPVVHGLMVRAAKTLPVVWDA